MRRRPQKDAADVLTPPARGGQFSAGVVRLALNVVLDCGAAMRCAAATLTLVAERLGSDIVMPSVTAIRSWLLRIGCHALTCALPVGRWVWLVDHTVQIGPCKLLVILGCRTSDLPLGERPLRQSDLRLIGLSLMEHSNAATVAIELERAMARTGVPRQIVSDEGSDLNGGVTLFQAQHAGVAYVHDAAHQAANVLKKRWSQDERWSSFVARLSQTAAKLRQTRLAHLVAPTIRPKARFMNVGPMARFMNVGPTLRFANRVLRLLDSPAPNARVEEHYGWLHDQRESLRGWTHEHAVAEATVAHVRTHGVGNDTAAELAEVWRKLDLPAEALSAGVRDAATRLARPLCEAGRQAQVGERLVASTEVLESTLGQLKRLEGSQSGDGFTGLSVALGTIVGHHTTDSIRTALDAVPNKAANGLITRLLGTTVQTLRRLFNSDPKTEPKPG